MNRTPREERQELERRIADFYVRAEELDRRSGMQITIATRIEIEREAASIYAAVRDLLEEVERLKALEETRRTVDSKVSSWIVGSLVSGGLLLAALSSGSWAFGLAAVISVVWTAATAGGRIKDRSTGGGEPWSS